MNRGTSVLKAPEIALKIAAVVIIAAQTVGLAAANPQPGAVTVIVVRHAESGISLTPAGQQRARLLAETFRDTKVTHLFASHTMRARETIAPLASARQLPVVQLPKPGSMLAGQPVTDATSRQAAIEPIGNAVLALPGGSVALVSANMDNIYGILNQLGVPTAPPGQRCAPGSLCGPCLTKDYCFPDDYDRA